MLCLLVQQSDGSFLIIHPALNLKICYLIAGYLKLENFSQIGLFQLLEGKKFSHIVTSTYSDKNVLLHILSIKLCSDVQYYYYIDYRDIIDNIVMMI